MSGKRARDRLGLPGWGVQIYLYAVEIQLLHLVDAGPSVEPRRGELKPVAARDRVGGVEDGLDTGVPRANTGQLATTERARDAGREM